MKRNPPIASRLSAPTPKERIWLENSAADGEEARAKERGKNNIPLVM